MPNKLHQLLAEAERVEGNPQWTVRDERVKAVKHWLYDNRYTLADLIDAAAISRDDAEWLVENEASGRALLIAERLAAVLARLEGTE